MHHIEPQPLSRAPHLAAQVAVVATFPLLWVGGLVTTVDAGMAVPDWPTTFGYNPFLYPFQTWLWGPYDIFVEHGHRLLGALVGLLTILMAWQIWRHERRMYVLALAVLAVIGVVAQGVLGGMRVRMDSRLLAQVHACTGPAFLVLLVVLANLTDPRRQARSDRPRPSTAALDDPASATSPVPSGKNLWWLAAATSTLAYLQLVVGSFLRHVSPTTSAGNFSQAVLVHLAVAAALVVFVVSELAISRRTGQARLTGPASWLAFLLGGQLALGMATWVTNYGWPAWFAQRAWAQSYVVTRMGLAQSWTTTAHVAVGTLIVAMSVVLALRWWQFCRGPTTAFTMTAMPKVAA